MSTNVTKILDKLKIYYQLFTKEEVENNEQFHQDSLIFKTLVTVSNTNKHYVFVVPLEETLNLKKAAKVVNEKSIEMIKQKDLYPLTGYYHGGCSPIGMKKEFKTVIDEFACVLDKIIVSAGDVDYRIMINVKDLEALLHDASFADITN